MRSLSVELKLAAAVLAVCIGAAIAGAELAGAIFEGNVEATALSALQDAGEVFAAHERAEVEKLATTLDVLLANDEMQDAFVARDRARLLALAAPMFETMRQRDRITHWYFIEPGPTPTVYLRVHEPEMHGDRVDRATLKQAIETGDLGVGKDLGQTAFALRVVRPWFSGGQLLGYVELAEEITQFLTAMKSRTGDEYGLLLKKELLNEQAWARVLGPRSSTWNDRPDVVVVDATAFTEGITEFDGDVESIPDRGASIGEVERRNRAFVRGIFPVRDATGRKVGGLFVLHDFTRHHAAMHAGLAQARLILLAIGVVSGVAILALLRRLVFAPLARLRRGLDAEGLPPGRYVDLDGGDEFERLEALFRRASPRDRTLQDADPGATQDAQPRSAGGERR